MGRLRTLAQRERAEKRGARRGNAGEGESAETDPNAEAAEVAEFPDFFFLVGNLRVLRALGV